MRLHRFLKEEHIDLSFDPFSAPQTWRVEAAEGDEEPQDEDEELTPKRRFERKVTVLKALVDLLVPSGKISNANKCLTDLRNREAKATTGLGQGIALPHVRTQQARDFVMGVAIAPPPGLDFEAVDDEPVRLFFPMVAPPHNDRYYRKVEAALGRAFVNEDDTSARDALLGAESPGEVIVILRDLID